MVILELSTSLFNLSHQESLMEYATIPSKYCCGIDLHARSMYVCIMDRAGQIQFHRNLKNDFALLTQVLKPYRRSVSIGVESTYNW